MTFYCFCSHQSLFIDLILKISFWYIFYLIYLLLCYAIKTRTIGWGQFAIPRHLTITMPLPILSAGSFSMGWNTAKNRLEVMEYTFPQRDVFLWLLCIKHPLWPYDLFIQTQCLPYTKPSVCSHPHTLQCYPHSSTSHHIFSVQITAALVPPSFTWLVICTHMLL